mmetsp:Transcript_30647/g.67333  ORF Transcript_30647/g.67333 Transcript_30647/m.67333 type:complete len:300 (-) Transcript_30647:376-1275(-)|eukprot:CAMPEP_0178707010 /NCGR_PEP_ID=MMETSP0699-20121125/15750_1 /TAXON_ID=265572 /ORGANISM="Extubocellulus spinifer, Strain CCMP396" /LENGTH=299 /DNA_ID=CAMNT_0020354925 /DNA_START=66 /DNA_END=965 /DNA_ORIENTATION=-
MVAEYSKIKAEEAPDHVELSEVGTSEEAADDAELSEVVTSVEDDGHLPVAKAVAWHGDALMEEMVVDADEKKPPPASDTERSTRRIRVVPSCDLPSQYRLTVKLAEGDIIDVIIPDEGVHRGETFEAEAIAPNPLIRGFSDDICGCCSADCGLLLTALFCLGPVFGAILERMKLDWLANPGPYKKTFAVITAFWLVYFLANFLQNLFLVAGEDPDPFLQAYIYVSMCLFLVITTRTRMAFRKKYRIRGNCCGDFCTVYWCGCCSAVQMHRHMKKSGEPPRPFKAPVAYGTVVTDGAEIV